MLFRKLWRTMGLYKAQFISMIIMIALGIGVFIGFNMEWVSIQNNTEYLFDKTGFSDFHIINEAGFSADDLDKIADIDGVEAAGRYLSVNADVKDEDGDSVALTVSENSDVSGVYLMSGDEYDSESEDKIWLSDKFADANEISVGDKFAVVYKNIEIEGKVAGLVKSGEHLICVRDETQLMPDYATHGFAYISPAMYKKFAKVDYYPQINVISDMDKKDFSDAVDKALDKTTLITTKDETVSYAQSNGEIEEGKTMGTILPVLFLAIAVLTMVTTMHRLTAKEKTQIGTLKALGFKDKRIMRHYTSYAFMIGLIGSAAGLGFGYFIAWLVMNPNGMMGTYMDMPQWKLCMPWFCVVILIAIIALLTLIGFLSVKQMLRGTAADALRPYTPKKMKKLLLERTKLWNKLGFGTRWNMRDIMRHKSRTAMSLVGILGCTVIIMAAFGMRDTMNSFIDLYYNGATNYSSRIYLSEDATPEQRDEIADKYRGDRSASIGVQIEDKTVSLDIYDVRNDKVRFPDKKDGYTEIGDSGAYICTRIADEYKLEEGDSFTLSPYGTNKDYKLKVAGVIRSVSENVVISPKYAEKLEIPYVIDSVYTDTDKADITASDVIKSVQSKQMIMDSFNTFIDLMDTMIVILVIAAAVLGVVVLYNLGVMSYTERYREMATLKVVGFKDRKIGRLLIGQNMWLTLTGVIVGIPAGIGMLSYLVNELASEYEMNLSIGIMSYVLCAVLTFGVSLLVSFMVARKNRHIDMVEALKGAE